MSRGQPPRQPPTANAGSRDSAKKRAALVRALVQLRVDVMDDIALGELLQADPVKRGAQRTAAAASAVAQGATLP